MRISPKGRVAFFINFFRLNFLLSVAVGVSDSQEHRRRIIQKVKQRLLQLVGRGGILECCASSHLLARMIWSKILGRTSILGGGWVGCAVWTGWSSIFLKHPCFYSSFSSNHPGTKWPSPPESLDCKAGFNGNLKFPYSVRDGKCWYILVHRPKPKRH